MCTCVRTPCLQHPLIQIKTLEVTARGLYGEKYGGIRSQQKLSEARLDKKTTKMLPKPQLNATRLQKRTLQGPKHEDMLIPCK